MIKLYWKQGTNKRSHLVINFLIGWLSIDTTGIITYDLITKRNHFIIL